ncbi:MAG: serine/threonine-protein kinase [Gemmatimonadota bacterium]
MNTVPETLRAALTDRYALERELGSGGMAVVYLAHDIRHRRAVAVKVLREDVTRSIGAERFLREIEIAAQLQHPHILTLIDSGQADGFLYYVMPFVAGGSLRNLLDRTGPLEPPRLVEMVREVADALDYAHRRGLVHRDIKPENILLSEGHAMVADFGIASAVSSASGPRMTRTGIPIGTPGYMSPEQAAGVTDVGPRSDVFSLAAVAYELAVGDVPGRWLTEEAVRLGKFLDAPPNHRTLLDRLPGGAEQALTRALAVTEAERWAGPLEFARALSSAFGDRLRYDAESARRIVDRAAEIQARAPDSPPLTLGGIQRIAAEVGIPPEHVREAAAAIVALPAPQSRNSIIGGREGPAVVERVVPGEVNPALYPALVQDLAVTMGDAGLTAIVGRDLRWRMVKGEVPRDVTVSIIPEGGRTRVRIDDKLGDLRWVWGFALAIAGGLGGFAVAAALIPNTLVGGIAGISTWVGACLVMARRGFRRQNGKRRLELEELADRLTRHIAGQSALPSLPAPDGENLPRTDRPARTPA